MLSLIRIVVLGLWVGALAGFAFFFAPIAFAHIGPTQPFAATIAASVRALTSFGMVCALIALLATIGLARESVPRAIAIGALLVIGSIFGFVETHAIVPRMESTPLQTPAYDALHAQSSRVYGLALLCALAALVVSAWPRRSP